MRTLPGRRKASSSDSDKPALVDILDHYGIKHPSHGRGKILCPFHSEDRPSAVVDCEESWLACHACGAGAGDAWGFVIKYENEVNGKRIDFLEAKQLTEQWLGKEFGSRQHQSQSRPGRRAPDARRRPKFKKGDLLG